MPPAWAKMWEIVRPVALTAFGAMEISKVTGKVTPFIYHGVDHSVFRIPSPTDPIVGPNGLRVATRRQARKRFSLNPDHIILLTAERHMPRKNLNALLRAVAPILEERDDVDLLIHNRPNDFGGDLNEYMSRFPQRVLDHMLMSRAHDTWRGLPVETLAALHVAADVYLSAGPEGFGLNLANSLACGVPCIGIDYSAVPEVIGPGGMLVPPLHLVDNPYSHYWAVPDEAAYTETIRKMIEPGVAKRLGRLGAEHAKAFDWDVVAAQFIALFNLPNQQAIAA